LLVAGDGHLSTHQLTGREVVIGRGEGCDVVIDHRSLSRRHALFRPGPPPTVQDLGSTNGTLVAGALRHGGDPVPLGAGDGFRIGPFSFVIVGRQQGEQSLSVTGREQLRVMDPTPRAVPGLVRDFSRSGASVLILGETGVGKEVLAETVHQLSGRTGELTRINCAALTENLLESELFGHEKGAFTGAVKQTPGKIETAHGGTLFLDEIGDLPLSLQAKLLRFLQERVIERIGGRQEIPVDVRIVCATHQSLKDHATTGRFREDLYYRLAEIVVEIPALRTRSGDVALLAHSFVRRFAAEQRRGSMMLMPEALSALESHSWPGNVRELENVLKRAVIMAEGNRITAADIGLEPNGDVSHFNLRQVREEAEKHAVLRVLARVNGNLSKAAELLGVSRPTLYDLMHRFGLR
jgi:two-component system NtrC family response regulator